jgi:hypothetical protein
VCGESFSAIIVQVKIKYIKKEIAGHTAQSIPYALARVIWKQVEQEEPEPRLVLWKNI